MLRKILLPTIFALLSWGFWISPDFKVISAGVSIFLFGMLSLEDGFRAFTGGILEKILRKSTNRMWKSLTFGFTTCTLMQSSSLVSVITISFLSANLIGLVEGLGIVFGANVGSTTGAWLIAGFGLKVKLSAYAMPMLVFGILLIFQKSKSLKGLGYILAGLGFLFLGIHYMKEGFETFQHQINLTDYAMGGFTGILVFTLIGILATIIMQSSHATLVLVITALSVHQITYENALALTIGANVGTTITAVIGSLTANVNGRRLALSDVLFKVSAGIVFILFLHSIMDLVNFISTTIGIADDNYTLKLAVFHTLFNIAGVIIMVPLVKPLVQLVSTLLPKRDRPRERPLFLNESAYEFPDTAVESVRNETLHIWDIAIDLLSGVFGFKRSDVLSEKDLYQVAQSQQHLAHYDIDSVYEQKIKVLYGEIVAFISKAGFSWEMEQSGQIHWLRKANQNIVDAIKDTKHLQKNLVIYANSPNPHMREAYTKIRVELALLIRKLEAIRLETEDEDCIFSLDHLRLLLDEHISNMNKWLANAIRNNLITPEMATSLMNDVSYATDVYRNLLQMGETLFVKQNLNMSEATRAVLLDDDELDEINKQLNNT